MQMFRLTILKKNTAVFIRDDNCSDIVLYMSNDENFYSGHNFIYVCAWNAFAILSPNNALGKLSNVVCVCVRVCASIIIIIETSACIRWCVALIVFNRHHNSLVTVALSLLLILCVVVCFVYYKRIVCLRWLRKKPTIMKWPKLPINNYFIVIIRIHPTHKPRSYSNNCRPWSQCICHSSYFNVCRWIIHSISILFSAWPHIVTLTHVIKVGIAFPTDQTHPHYSSCHACTIYIYIHLYNITLVCIRSRRCGSSVPPSCGSISVTHDDVHHGLLSDSLIS